jgi:hypothetical protein
MEKYDFYVMIESRASKKKSAKYVWALGQIPYAEFEKAFREIFTRYGIPEDATFAVDMELNDWEYD